MGPITSTSRPIRLWPAILFAGLIVPVRFLLPIIWPDGVIFAVLGSVLLGLAVMLWWAFFSRAPRADRWGGFALMIAAMAAAWALADPSMSTGAMGMLVPLLAIPVLGFALGAWAVAARNLSRGMRLATMAATIVAACGIWTLTRTDGMTSDAIGSDLRWRWTLTAEERLLAGAAATLPAIPATTAIAPPAAMAPAAEERPVEVAPGTPAAPGAVDARSSDTPAAAESVWPGFRGAARDSVIRDVRIETDWSRTPPRQLWRRPIGPGWSSFAVNGDLIYTQEQRGQEEIVAAYRLSSGEPVWAHRDAVRFWESNGGAGPRATPTLEGGRLYSFGATGMLNALDARTGATIWSRDVAAATGVKIPDWGFSSSPLLLETLVVVAAAGKLAAFDKATGEPRWSGVDHGASYSSPHLLTIQGTPQIVLLTGTGAASVRPDDGTQLWELTFPASAMAATIVQPALTADGDVLVGDGTASTMRRIALANASSGWTVTERWASNRLKPYFNDFVVHKGHAYGFDGTILACLDVADGGRKWKGGRYGNGQLMLIADQDLLLVTSEEGELALVSATPDGFKEIARVPALEGKTWNHPVLAGDVLLVRNGEEMAAFRLSRSAR
jgi:outer membrane protein assembly factor BamB